MDSRLVFVLLISSIVMVIGGDVVSEGDNATAIGPCVNGGCPPGSSCVKQECYPTSSPKLHAPLKKIKGGRKSNSAKIPIGPCVNGKCPNGYECKDDQCFRANNASSSGQKVEAIGSCVNNLCPNGYSCNMDDYQCYRD